MRTVDLTSRDIQVTIDPGRGADVLSLVDRRTGVDVLFTSPWRQRADAIRNGQTPSTFDPVAGWMEQYRGGWQTLCPSAGDPRLVHGAPIAFHGEASVVSWTVDETSVSSAQMHVELFAVPIRISRTIELDGARLGITDSLTNLSSTPLEFDYSHHPALGGAFLDGECRIETGARRFTSDPNAGGLVEPGSAHEWPVVVTGSGERIDLRGIPGPTESRSVFGWLDDFTDHWASVTNIDLGLTVRIDWDGEHLPYAWLWEELNATEGFPWYRRARTIAIEPASMQTSGSGRRSVLRLAAGASARISIRVSIENWRS